MYDNVLAKPINEIQHAGVKGMKWGVRKDKSSGTSKSKSKNSKKSAVERLNSLDKHYNKFFDKHGSKIHKAMQYNAALNVASVVTGTDIKKNVKDGVKAGAFKTVHTGNKKLAAAGRKANPHIQKAKNKVGDVKINRAQNKGQVTKRPSTASNVTIDDYGKLIKK